MPKLSFYCKYVNKFSVKHENASKSLFVLISVFIVFMFTIFSEENSEFLKDCAFGVVFRRFVAKKLAIIYPFAAIISIEILLSEKTDASKA